MSVKYSEITKHIPTLEEYGHLFFYYGQPYSDECLVYGESRDGKHLIVSPECDDLLTAIAEEFESKYDRYSKWLDVLENNNIRLEKIFDVEVETQEFEVVTAILMYLVVSISYEDRIIDALNTGFMVRLLKKLKTWQ